MFFFTSILFAQVDEPLDFCGVQHTDEEINKQLIEQSQYANQIIYDTFQSQIIPVRFTVQRLDDGRPPRIRPAHVDSVQYVIDQADIDSALLYLNQRYSPLNISFIQRGPINFIDDYKIGSERSAKSSIFSYSWSSMDVRINQTDSTRLGIGGSTGAILESGVSAGLGGVYLRDSAALRSGIFAHEVGHVFRLIHLTVGASVYDNPNNPNQNSPGIFRDRNTRELAIREEEPSRNLPFPIPNHGTAGDGFQDTPAWGSPGSISWPDPNSTDCFIWDTIFNDIGLDCISGIVVNEGCEYIGNYIDYNGDTIKNQEIAVRNLMNASASLDNCITEFTPSQISRIQSHYLSQEIVQLWDKDDGFDIQGKVEVWNTSTPLRNANIMFSHPNQESGWSDKFSRLTTPGNGIFYTTLHDSLVFSKAVKLGSGEYDTDYNLRPSAIDDHEIFSFTDEDWISDITVGDVLALQRHILGLESFNSFQKLSGDINRNGNLSVLDMLLIKRLILGIDNSFSHYPSGPWQFVPETISTLPGFVQGPFNISYGDSTFTNKAPYIKSNWLYKVNNLNQAGFDVYKLGDVSGDVVGMNFGGSSCQFIENELVVESDTLHSGNEYTLTISSYGTEPVAGYQFEIKFDEEIVNINSVMVDKVESDTSNLEDVGAILMPLIKQYDSSDGDISISYIEGDSVKNKPSRLRFMQIAYLDSTLTSSLMTGRDFVTIDFTLNQSSINDPKFKLLDAIAIGSSIPFQVFDLDGCRVDDQKYMTFSKIPGNKTALDTKPFERVKDNKSDLSLDIHPNPVQSSVLHVVSSSLDKVGILTIYTVAGGKKILSRNIKFNLEYSYDDIDLSGLPTGAYVVKLETKSNTTSKKFIYEK